MRNVLEELYHGRISPWERKATQSVERSAVNKKIEDEKRYFIEKMSLDDSQRFQAFENLYSQSNDFEQLDAFSHGFTLGALIMMDVMTKKEALTNG